MYIQSHMINVVTKTHTPSKSVEMGDLRKNFDLFIYEEKQKLLEIPIFPMLYNGSNAYLLPPEYGQEATVTNSASLLPVCWGW